MESDGHKDPPLSPRHCWYTLATETVFLGLVIDNDVIEKKKTYHSGGTRPMATPQLLLENRCRRRRRCTEEVFQKQQ